MFFCPRNDDGDLNVLNAFIAAMSGKIMSQLYKIIVNLSVLIGHLTTL